MELPERIGAPVARLGAAAQNALEVARFGGLETEEDASPYEVVAEQPVYRLRHYFPAGGDGQPPVVLVPPMMLSAEVYDVAPSVSAVATLSDHGADPWVVDFGAPEREEGGLERTLTDHLLAVSDAVERVREATGRDVHLGGYSQGGMFCYQAAAYRRNDGIGSLVTFGSPVDMSGIAPFGVPGELATRAAGILAQTPLATRAVPAWMSRIGFRLLDPVKSARQWTEFLLQLHDRDALLPRERQRRFLMGEGWVAWPGPALAEMLRQIVAHNRMLRGGIVIEDRLVTLADIDCPVLTFVGAVDEIAPIAGVRAIRQAAPRAEIYEVSLHAGHFGLVVGSAAAETTWPVVAAWARWRQGQGELPQSVVAAGEAEEDGRRPRAREQLVYGVGMAIGAGAETARSLADSAGRTARAVRELGREAAMQVPRLARLEQIGATTQISLGLVLDEQARRNPGDVCFLFEDRAHTQEAVKARIDAVVRGLIEIGVHQGEHVGVLMGPRPTALALVAALNRLGAVAVLLRPDGDTAREVALGEVDKIIADPEHAKIADGLGTVHSFVLGGGAEPRDLGVPLTDMERIDPDEVPVPAWYEPNPGRARDLAFIVFTGQGEATRMSRITNGRWARSAYGTASSAALTQADTVYAVTPIYHPSALLMSVGGALAGGARLAMAREFDPQIFWDEVRRYGVTVTSYTWTLLHDLAEAPPHPGERHHPLRLFIGSGMPPGLWRRVSERFAPARVVEFYASTEGDAILVNLSGEKAGSMGRPLPGSAQVRIARYDPGRDRLVEGPDGLAEECETGEAGMLLARIDPATAAGRRALRGVFAPGDAWFETGDLFRRDEDGDYWLVDHVTSLIRTKDGFVAARPMADALGALRAVDLAVAYGLPAKKKGEQIAVAAVTLRSGCSLAAKDVGEALAGLEPERRPAVVHVVEEIPLTTWYRPLTGPLRKRGLPEPGSGRPAFYRDGRGAYRKLTAAARKRLAPRGV